MHGDFSRWNFDGRTNHQGILHQQGRLLVDDDVNHQTFFSIRWQQLAGRDIIGPGVAAIPAEEPDALAILGAVIAGDAASIQLHGGRGWVNGQLLHLRDDVTWRATRIGTVTDHGAPGTRDAIVLETWLESVSAFQDTSLLEPALGGVDTTERLQLATALRLVRMTEDEHCDDVARRIGADPGGRLTVTLEPGGTSGDPDCPIEDPGGYHGPEHHLYRLECMRTDAGADWIKWSRYGGGLVGRGRFDLTTGKLHLDANRRAIATSGLPGPLYVEALVRDDDLGHWRVAYGGMGSLANDDEIDLGARHVGTGDIAGTVFVRIWDGAAPISTFPATGALLPFGDGIIVAIESAGSPGDYWTFTVRAGLPNASTLLAAQSAHGVARSRVPLGVVTWPAAGGGAPEIDDCRRPLAPLTRRDGCCTVRVGDGVTSHGDVTSLQEAFDRLPEDGGTICVLPGRHDGGHLSGARNVTIHGCGPLSVIVPVEGATAAIRVTGSTVVRIHDLFVDATEGAVGIRVGGPASADACAFVTIERVWALARDRSAIHATSTMVLAIRDCVAASGTPAPTEDAPSWAAITVAARDAVVERNFVVGATSGGSNPNVNLSAGPSAGGGVPLGSFTSFTGPLVTLFTGRVGLGGIWVRGGSERVRVVDNDISGGLGHGVVLGHADVDTTSAPWPGLDLDLGLGWPFGGDGPCAACADGGSWIPWVDPSPTVTRLVPGPALREIEVAGNRIRNMGMSAVGVGAFFGQPQTEPPNPVAIRIETLAIRDNALTACLTRDLAPIAPSSLGLLGYGAIALADTHTLTVAGNRIDRIGVNRTDPVCGVYVLRAEQATVRDNRMHQIGRALTAGTGEPGPRGGVWIERSLSSLAIRGNDIVAAVGPALRAACSGATTIIDNALASRSLDSGDAAMTGTTVRLLTPDLAATPGLLLDLGAAIRYPPPDGEAVTITVQDNAAYGVVFADNQVSSMHSVTGGLPHAPIAILGFFDVGFTGNQCVVASAPVDSFATQATIVARTLRVGGNRFTEALARCVVASAVAYGRLAIVSTNIADHCLVAGATRLVMTDNLADALGLGTACEVLANDIVGRIAVASPPPPPPI
jgi:hypothetical protein